MKKLLILLVLGLSSFIGGDKIAVIKKQFYTVHYSLETKTPLWTEYVFTRKNLNEVAPRTPNFRKDDAMANDKQACNGDYEQPYDRGHLTPDHDMCFSTDAELSTMVFTNCAPQHYQMNRGVWKSIENYVRDIGSDYDTLYVYTGVIFDDKPKVIGNGVMVPKYFWKSVKTRLAGRDINTIGFICTNGPQASKDIKSFIITVDSLEKLTKIDIFNSDNFEDNNIFIHPHPER